jgi:hypothetical protein
MSVHIWYFCTMNNNQLNKNEAFDDDPEHYFDDQQFSTVVLNSVDFTLKNVEEIKNLVALLTSGIREDKDQALLLLKREDGRELLMSAIASKEFRDTRNVLVAACWESGLDFSKYFESFIIIALSGNFIECMESVTVIENMERIPSEELKNLAIQKLEESIKTENEKNVLYVQLLDFLR